VERAAGRRGLSAVLAVATVATLLLLTARPLSVQTVVFRRRVMMIDGGPPLRQMTVRLDRFEHASSPLCVVPAPRVS